MNEQKDVDRLDYEQTLTTYRMLADSPYAKTPKGFEEVLQ